MHGGQERFSTDVLGNHLDRIVRGTRDKTGFERYVLGRVAEKVVPTSSVPVHIGDRDG
ncbi:universal stress protein [Natronococcus amylolyticus]|uniref:universal stress protein n=1 Tax=Natronococcus amylolyticus TaxID=44470 RepID=UPI0019D382B4